MNSKFLILVIAFALICAVGADDDEKEEKKDKKGKGGKKAMEHKWMCKGEEVKLDDDTKTALKECWEEFAERFKKTKKSKGDDEEEDDGDKKSKKKRDRRDADDEEEKKPKKKGKKAAADDEDGDDDKKSKKKPMMHFKTDGKFIACQLKKMKAVVDGKLDIAAVNKWVEGSLPKDVQKDAKTQLKKCADAVEDGKFADDDAYAKFGKCKFAAFKKVCKNTEEDDL